MALKYARKTNYVFGQLIMAAFLVLGAAVFLSFKIYAEADVYLGVFFHHLKTSCQCTDVIQFLNMHPDVFIAVMVFAIASSSLAVFAIYKFISLLYSTRKFTKSNLSSSLKKHSWKLNYALKEAGIDRSRVKEIRSDGLVIFCYGLLFPKICISNSLVGVLDRSELKAVLLHEKQHMETKEPLKLFIVMFLQNALFLFPVIKKLARKYLTYSELSADERAYANPNGKSKLASAMYKITEASGNSFRSGVSVSAIDERVNRLADDAYVPNFKHLGKSLIACSAIFIVLWMAAFSVFSKSTKAYDMHSEGICEIKNNEKIDFINVLEDDQGSCAMHIVSHNEEGGACESK